MDSTECPFALDVDGSDQHAENARLRAAGRAVPVRLPGDVRAWAIPHHDDLRRVLTDPRFAKGMAHWGAAERGEVPDGWPLIGFVSTDSVINAHGADHRRLRGLVDQALTPARVEAMRPGVERLVDTLLDRLAARPADRPVDFRKAFAYPIPTAVISDLLGVPRPKRRLLHVLTGMQTRTTNTPEQVLETDARIEALLREIVAERRDSPGDDLISALLTARRAGDDRLSDSELHGMILLMFFAGHQSVINVLVNACHALLTHPEQLAAARAGEVPWSAVVEETMRWNGAVNQFPMRYPVEDVVVGGETIRRGEAVLASFGSAGRDPEHHGADADRFDVRRRQAGHLGFGHGPHFCVGVHLARLQLETALAGFFTRFPGVRPAPPGTWTVRPVPSFVSNSIEELPLLLGPAASTGAR
ncbi:cytochrome P450 [Streptomyces niveiscabiei]|uniref:cytochrome P450 family protein n=1 Tax=Streptomyces niveiscabiei TaxID=164115 RepID=UPI0029BE3940|nr:cytochrome P450 [Streptomyces niveiscabiei]MDX3386192.1 cytochrome P450 [Streptomyces niveiscabiei]